MRVQDLNAFCRKFDLFYLETGRTKGQEVYWFKDLKEDRRYYTKEEIYAKLNSIGYAVS